MVSWVWRLEANHGEAARLVGEKTYRVWRVYMAACARAFATGRIGIIQALFAKPDNEGSCELPLNRDDLYNKPLIQH
ncbi:MAG: class I SAM-dependent methyltransferase [Chloroflexi bacterium]|nr:class I SAM-dependent methyltransferase [Chloroflexota bacterium]